MFIWQIPSLGIQVRVNGVHIRNNKTKVSLISFIQGIENIPLFVVLFFFIKVDILGTYVQLIMLIMRFQIIIVNTLSEA